MRNLFMKNSIIKNILVNTAAFFTTNLKKIDNDSARRIARLEEFVNNHQKASADDFLYHTVLAYYAAHPDKASSYRQELDFLHRHGRFANFPYPSIEQSVPTEQTFDREAQLPYVIHNGKKLYFPTTGIPQDIVAHYHYLVNTERLTGDSSNANAPHQYQSLNVKVNDGDLLFDIGAAEGLFSLDLIDKVSKAVIVESDEKWMKPLQATFAPYKDKVVILQKFISAFDTDNTMSISSLLSKFDLTSAFVKMDIEGNELPSLLASANTIIENQGIKWSIASYHRQNDHKAIVKYLTTLGLDVETSVGNMLFNLYDTPVPPYFRKGIVRAKHKAITSYSPLHS